MGFEPMNTGFADQRVSHFATGAHVATYSKPRGVQPPKKYYSSWVVLNS
jgi:hypothetical protein